MTSVQAAGPAPDPAARVDLHKGSDVSGYVHDAELVDDPPETTVVRSDVVEVARRQVVHLATTLGRTGPGAAAGRALRAAPRVTARAGWCATRGGWSWAHRAVSAATFGRLREQVRLAAATGDKAALAEWSDRLEAAKDSRRRRLLALPRALLAASVVATSVVLVTVLLLAVGGMVALVAAGVAAWCDWWVTVRDVVDTVGAVVGALVVVAGLAAGPLLLILAWREGHRVASPPLWLLTPDEKAQDRAEITVDVITRALRHMQIPALTRALKAGAVLEFLVAPREQGGGTYFQVRLPIGCTAASLLPSDKVELLGGNLSRHKHEVWPQRQPDTDARVLDCWIADKGTMDRAAPPWPLLDDGTFNVFRERLPWGATMRGEPVCVGVLQKHWLVGANSKQGKTTVVRTLLLGLALDVDVELRIADLKGDGDFRMLKDRCHTYIEGQADEHAEAAVLMLESLLAEMARRYAEKARLNITGPITERLARQPGSGFHPIWGVVDECFPAGTLVGGVPIERLAPGDIVPSWDEVTGEQCDGVVVNTFRKTPKCLVRVQWEDGETLVCTPNHPLMTRSGWLPAGELTCTSEVLSYDRGAMLDLQGSVRGPVPEAGLLAEDGSSDLLARVPGGGQQAPATASEPVGRGAEALVGAHEGQQPDDGPRDTGTDGRDAAKHRTQAPCARREWAGSHGTAALVVGGPGMAHGGDRSDGSPADQGDADALQVGHSERRSDDCRGGGRRLAWTGHAAGAGRAQDRVARWRRVVRVQVLEPGSDGRYGDLCPDGFVYNFEVGATHTYLISDGVVAHNCQVMYMAGKAADGSQLGGSKDDARAQRAAKRLHDQARAVLIHLVQATQRPDPQTVPVRVREGAHVRVALYVPNINAARMILADAAERGARPHDLRPGRDAGTVVAAGEVEDIPAGQAFAIVRTHYVSTEQAHAVARRATEAWHRAGRQPVVADTPDEDGPDHLADIVATLRGKPRVRTQIVLARLAEEDPGTYEDWTFQDLGRVLGEHGVAVAKSDGLKIVRLVDVETAIAERDG